MLLRDMEKTLDHLLLSGGGIGGPDRTLTFAVQDIVRRCARYLTEFGDSIERVRDTTLAAIKKAGSLDARKQAERRANAQKAARVRWDKACERPAAPVPVKTWKARPDTKGGSA